MKTKRYVLGGYAVWVALLIAVYYGLSGLRIEAWGLISLSGVAAVLAGAAAQPARPQGCPGCCSPPRSPASRPAS